MQKLIKSILFINIIIGFFYHNAVVGHMILKPEFVLINKKLKTELRCMELNLHYEARGESQMGIIAVGHVTMNRVKNIRFPNSICGVVYQPYQFSWTINMLESTAIATKISSKIKEIAYNLVISKSIKDNTVGSLFFHNTTVKSFYERFGYKYHMQIGNHIFYTGEAVNDEKITNQKVSNQKVSNQKARIKKDPN